MTSPSRNRAKLPPRRRGVAPAADIVITGPDAQSRPRYGRQAHRPASETFAHRYPRPALDRAPGTGGRGSSLLEKGLETIGTPFMWTAFAVLVLVALAVTLAVQALAAVANRLRGLQAVAV